ncbi:MULTISPECIES: helix-turn-helix transcriptional regulator [unclassified Facklamia]|uniref:helix-turn-helix domain-containing protein n=1 Tax=Aerococcaceae TaxID=186827 RepID=UPI0013B8B086|nr:MULTISPECIES: helix-turn-helix transcriptional regulator [unclassified Facklamia]MBS4461596.1 helix-turn-helix transcriptional regulator [Aerococcaceae bacterium zg-B36]NEW63889.1 helix-turn-helix domain-containing protein [Facklamia sp. 252]NEW67360.1 helix-turn-helix domain-containing protein [Facklamia sp. 253]QQD65236.1 helix-turn-helix transcriptional regulator [Aerococcaceae bacterium zg-252]
MSFGQRIRKLRNEYQLSQDDLARELNMSQQSISRIENDIDVSISTAISFAQYFRVSLDYLCGLSTSKYPHVAHADFSDDHTQGLLYHYNTIEKTHQDIVYDLVEQFSKKFPKE